MNEIIFLIVKLENKEEKPNQPDRIETNTRRSAANIEMSCVCKKV